MSEPKEYELTTIEDIFNKIPHDKIELCLSELTHAILGYKATQAAFEALGQVFKFPELTWVDDGKNEITSNFINEETGALLGSVLTKTK